MVVKSKVAPEPELHPSLELSIGTEDQIDQLSKLYPVLLLNQQNESEELLNLRTNYKYLFVVNWLYSFRGFVKLQSETFDVDLFELELLNYFPVLYQEDVTIQNQTFLNKLKLSLMSSAQNSKLSSLNNFEKVFRLWFGYDTPLGGKDLDEETEEAEGYDLGDADENYPSFDTLSISDKIEVLYILIAYISSYATFRSWVDRNNISLELLRLNSIFHESKALGTTSAQEDYVLLFENNRLYKRTIKYNPLVVPKKRKASPVDPIEYYEPEQFDISPDIKYELISKNVYQFDEILKEYGKKKTSNFKTLVTKLSKKPVIESIFASEIRKRKFLAGKKKELQLAGLLATRKRSSRLEAKEKQRQEELRIQKVQEDYELKVAAEKRFERRMKLKQGQGFESVPVQDTSLTRDERLKLRRLEAEKSADGHENEAPEATEAPEAPEAQAVQENGAHLMDNSATSEFLPPTDLVAHPIIGESSQAVSETPSHPIQETSAQNPVPFSDSRANISSTQAISPAQTDTPTNV